MPSYDAQKFDPVRLAKLKIFIDTRERVGLTQDQAGALLGLLGSKRRDSVRAWEFGTSTPHPKRRQDFIVYLCDHLRLDRESLWRAWQDVMEDQWGWKPLSIDELLRWPDLLPDDLRVPVHPSRSSAFLPLEPPPADLPPTVDGFIGREDELSYFRQKLSTTHLAVITGFPGVGKTALASMLAQQTAVPNAIFWHAFRAGEDAVVVIRKLAEFLYLRNQQDMWALLESSRQSGAPPPAPDLLVDYLCHLLPAGGYVLCFDDFQHLDMDPCMGLLIRRLEPAVRSGRIKLIVTSRRVPSFVDTLNHRALQGLNLKDTRCLLANRDIALEDNLLQRLHSRTGGTPKILELAIHALRQRANPKRLIDGLEQAEHVAQYLLEEVDRGLSATEREVMVASALLEEPSTRQALETVLGGRRIWQELNSLCRSYLFSVTPEAAQGDARRRYFQHALLQAFYLDVPSASERRVMHLHAGEYHAGQKRSSLRAAYHFMQAGDFERAALFGTDDVWDIINQGQAESLQLILERIVSEPLSAAREVRVWIALGRIYTLQRQSQLSQAAYQKGFALLSSLTDPLVVRELRVVICRGMAELLKSDSPREALDWLNRGLAEVGQHATNMTVGHEDSCQTAVWTSEMSESFRQECATLYIEAGSVHVYLGNFVEARRNLEQGLSLLSGRPSRWRAAALINLGNVYSAQMDTKLGIEFYRRAIDISEELGDYWRVTSARHNLGIRMSVAGNWTDAVREYHEALAIAERLGSGRHKSALALSLGTLNIKRGDYQSAETFLRNCLVMAQDYALRDQVVAALSSLAELYLRQRRYEAAIDFLCEAERLELALDAQDQLPEIYRNRALASLGQERLAEAATYVYRSIEIAESLGIEWEVAVSRRVLGQVLSSSQQPGPAVAAFERSLGSLRDTDPYEAAQTKAQWGVALIARGEADQGTDLLLEAQDAFHALDARCDVTLINQILGTRH